MNYNNPYINQANEYHKEALQIHSKYSKNITSKIIKERKDAIKKERKVISLLNEAKNNYIEAAKKERKIASQEEKEILSSLRENNAKIYHGYAKKSEEMIKKITRNLEKIVVEPPQETRSKIASFFLPIASIIAFALTLVFSLFNITGFIISDTTNSIENYISLGFFLLGVIFASLYLRKIIRDKNKKLLKRKK